MKLRDDDGYGRVSMKVPTVILMASAAIFVVLAIVLAVNSSGSKKKNPIQPIDQTSVEMEEAQTPQEDKLTAGDLDFWGMYQDGDETTVLDQITPDSMKRKDELEKREEDMKQADIDAANEAERLAEENADPASDGKHTKVVHPDGSTEWLVINSSLGLNTYEDTSFQSKGGIIGYYSGGKKTSVTGADISQYTTSVDFARLKTEVDYVMIRAGARGYDTGKIIPDTKFVEYVVGAANAGIPFGVYFSSQAITEEEAAEEADFVMKELAYAQSVVENKTQVTSSDSTQTAQSTDPAANKDVPGYVDPAKYGTTSSTTDQNGDVTTVQIDSKGNQTITIKDKNGILLRTTTVNTDPYGNVTTVVTDAEGNQTVETVNKYDYIASHQQNTNNTAANSSDPDATQKQTQSAAASAGYNSKFRVTYPIAIEMHLIPNAKSRIETLTNAQRTQVLNAFCTQAGKGGYNAMIQADKEFLLCRMNLGAVAGNGIWVSNEGNLPDYPYDMMMWKYNTKSTLLKSLTGEYGVDAGFVDYSIR